MISDITERRRAEELVLQTNDELNRQARQLNDLNDALWRSFNSKNEPLTGGNGPRQLDDPGRLATLARTRLMDLLPMEAFDRFTRLGAVSLKVPVCLISLVDARRQCFKSAQDLPEPWASRRETPLTHSFCHHVVTSGLPLVVNDATQHPVVCENLAIRDHGVAAYLGVPLTTPDGFTLGSFCAIDSQPRQWTDADRTTL